MSLPTVPICRICLTNDELQVSLFSEYAQRKLLLTKIRACLPITITHADTLPVTICSQCINRLEQFYEYYCKSETSQRILTEGTGILTAQRKLQPENYPLNATGNANGEVTGSGTRTCVMSNHIEHGGSMTVAEQMDPILTQSPQVKGPIAQNEMLQSNAPGSPGATLSFLLQGSKERRKRKHNKPSTQNEFTTF
uniref:ZAD domain-containing protein n=1 Tax=Anopheles christyi TaxID=43041 RepID=A0A182JR81_9DIPT